MKNNNIHRSSIPVILAIGLLSFFFVFSQWQTIHERFDNSPILAIKSDITSPKDSTIFQDKQRGAHVFGRLDSSNFQFLYRNNIEWVTLVAWASQGDYDSPIVRHHNGDSLRMRQSDADWIKRLELVHSQGFKVFFKPHVWIDNPSDGKWRSDVFPTNEANWESWKKSYREFILRYANLAQQADVEMFCIGTEFSKLSVQKPLFWKALIQEVRTVYSGQITYAANWYNEYEKITFWGDLDYIGIQAYFPLVKNKYPSVRQISKGWRKYLPTIKSIHKKYNRPILFSEIGYKSTADSAIRPWEWMDNPYSKDKAFSAETQANCYEAFFNTLWEKEWFAGIHIWQLRSDNAGNNGKNHLGFTPLGKPAEGVIAKGFK